MISAWKISSEGRKHRGGSAIHDAGGRAGRGRRGALDHAEESNPAKRLSGPLRCLRRAADAHDHAPSRDRPRLPAAQAPRARAGVLAAVRRGARLLPGGDRGALHGGAADGRRPGRAGPARAVGVRAGRVRQRPAVRGLVAVLGRARDRVQDRDGGQAARAGGVGAAARGCAAGGARERGARAPAVRAAGLRRRGRAGRRRVGRDPLRLAAAERHAAVVGAAHAPVRAAARARRREALLGRRLRGREAAAPRRGLAARAPRARADRAPLPQARAAALQPAAGVLRRAGTRVAARGGARGTRLAARPAARDRPGRPAGLGRPAGARPRLRAGRAAGAPGARRLRPDHGRRRLGAGARAGRAAAAAGPPAGPAGRAPAQPADLPRHAPAGLRRRRAGRGRRALRPAAAGGRRDQRLRLGPAALRRGDDAERGVQPDVGDAAGGRAAPRGPPLRVDPRGVRGLGFACRRRARLLRPLSADRPEDAVVGPPTQMAVFER